VTRAERIRLGEAFQEFDGVLELAFAGRRSLQGGLLGGFVETERSEFRQRRLTLEILCQRFEAVLRVGMASDRGEVTAFHEIGSGGRGDLAETTTERHEFVEALRRAGVQGGTRLQ
jgi:hypothetical protein